MFEQYPVLQESYFGNLVFEYLRAVFIFACTVILLYGLQRVLIGRLKKIAEKSETRADDVFFAAIEKKLFPILYVGAFYFAANQLILSLTTYKVITALAVIVIVFQGTSVVAAIALYLLERHWISKGQESTAGGMTGKTILAVVKVVIWGIAVIIMLDNLGVNVSAMVAGLGIGGVAVALAAQNILGDLFNYFVIFFDRPFREGDFIIIGDYMGVIEHVGLKTTRIRSLGGEQIVFSNSDLCSSRIRNYKRMQQRRILFKFGVLYETTSEQLKKVPEIVKGIIGSISSTRFDRAHFQKFGDSSLDFEVVYYLMSADYNVYMDVQQEINFKLKEAIEKEGMSFAYPTRTLYVNNVAQSVT